MCSGGDATIKAEPTAVGTVEARNDGDARVMCGSCGTVFECKQEFTCHLQVKY